MDPVSSPSNESSNKILTPKPLRVYTPMSPFSRSLLGMLSPIHRYISEADETPSFYNFSPFTAASSQLSFGKKYMRSIQKLEFSAVQEYEKLQVNSVSIELILAENDQVEHSQLLTALAGNFPGKRNRKDTAAGPLNGRHETRPRLI